MFHFMLMRRISSDTIRRVREQEALMRMGCKEAFGWVHHELNTITLAPTPTKK